MLGIGTSNIMMCMIAMIICESVDNIASELFTNAMNRLLIQIDFGQRKFKMTCPCIRILWGPLPLNTAMDKLPEVNKQIKVMIH